MKTRQATNQEILAECRRYSSQTVSYRHFTKEFYNPRAANGVTQRQKTNSKVRDVNGVPHVMHDGKLEAITAVFVETDTGRTFVADIRIDSPHLPAAF